MNKKFTKLIAAVALLTLLIPMRGWGQTTVTTTSFSATSGTVGNDDNVSYAAYKGGGTANPAVNSNAIRLYQNSDGATGGYVVIGVPENYEITSATIQSTMATTTGYKLTDTDPGDTTPAKNTFNVSNYSLNTNTDYTVNNISTRYIVFACFGTSSSSRLYLSKISITYQSTGGGSDPEIVIPTAQLALSYEEDADGNFDVSYNNFTPAAAWATLYSDSECNSPFPTTGPDAWIVLDDNYDDPYTSLAYILEANPTAADRTVYLKIEATDDESNDLDAVFTITQAGSPTYTVTYDGNGATSGTAPTDATAYSSGATVTVRGNTGSLEKTGCTFNGWNTQADGLGTDRAVGSTFKITANTTLYAQWLPNSHTITMPANDKYGTYTSVPASSSVDYGTEVTLTYTPAPGYENYEASWIINGTPIAGNKFNMPDADVTVTVAVTLTQWVLTDLASLTSADVFVIVGGGAYAMTNDNGASNPPVVSAVTISGSYLTSAVEENIQWHVSGNASGYIFYPKGSATTWLYSTSSNNGIRVGTNANKLFTMNSDGYLVNSATSRYLSIYINGTTPQDWRGYSNTDNNPQVITFYKKVAGDVTISKEIDGYGIGNGKWYLIAPPVASVASTSVVGGTYDLYYFDQSQAQEWRNYKKNAFAKLESGKGYLYAHDTDTVLPFTGQPYRGNGVVTLTKTDAVDFSGWNLVGNPFNSNATIPLDYYRMNGDGDGLIATDKSNAINPMEGVFVQAATNGATLTFTPSAKGTAETINQLVINVGKVKSGDAIDRAIVRFSESNTMQKLRILEGSAEIYIPQDGVDYAIVRSEAQGEMPVNFKAEKNGSYTLSIDIEADMDYLHLIDNMTGADVDLLQTPSYTFDARTSDYASRFRLLFSANTVDDNTSTGSATFAYFNGSEWVVNSNGNATLQVVDVMGRVLSSETVNGNHNMNLNLSTGVYMLRLVNGNDVKTQKIVVR